MDQRKRHGQLQAYLCRNREYHRILHRPFLFDIQKRVEIAQFLYERECPDCKGKRLNGATLSCKINGFNINDMCEIEFSKLRLELDKINDERATTIVNQLKASLDRMIDIGLPYLFMNRESSTLSGGEAQRLKLVRYMGSSLCGMIYIFDEPSTGMHPRDVHRMARLLKSLRDKGNTVLVVEHFEYNRGIVNEVTIILTHFSAKSAYKIYAVCNKMSVQR